ncbi:hypothetical protein [Methylocystis sp.]|uniref:hypothetical protein n=1 Tax=Methylocystis sp. TaxID=1911079 RepID=UPI0025EB5EC2|nr:hypothetical protein [Methylocystis sp.]
MNAPIRPPTFAAAQPTEAQLIACDAIVEFASIMCAESAALLAAAAAADVPAIEACLWTSRRTLTATIKSWRESVPPLHRDGAE